MDRPKNYGSIVPRITDRPKKLRIVSIITAKVVACRQKRPQKKLYSMTTAAATKVQLLTCFAAKTQKTMVSFSRHRENGEAGKGGRKWSGWRLTPARPQTNRWILRWHVSLHPSPQSSTGTGPRLFFTQCTVVEHK
jgi:hypothetical protein